MSESLFFIIEQQKRLVALELAVQSVGVNEIDTNGILLRAAAFLTYVNTGEHDG